MDQPSAMELMKSVDGPFRLTAASVPAGCFDLTEGPPPARDRDAAALLDIDIDLSGRILTMCAAGWRALPPESRSIPMQGRQVWPGFIDAHAHIDKSHTWDRAPNPDGTLSGARLAAKQDRAGGWHFEDAYSRMDFAIRTALGHGTVAIRTHLDSQEGRNEPAWSAFLAVREAWRSKMILSPVVTLGITKLAGNWGDHVADWAARHGAALGPVAYDSPTLDAELDRAIDLAERFGLDLDIHVDETDDVAANGLAKIAKAVLRRGFRGRVLCGHACNLSLRSDDEARAIIDLVKQSGLAIVSLPMVNLYLMDRAAQTTPRWRGLTLLRELRAAGVPVALGGDNVRDAFHPYGDHDLLDVFRDAVRLGHLDLPIGDWPMAVSRTPATLLGLGDAGVLRAGVPADLVIFGGRSYSEVLSRHGRGRHVLRSGRLWTEPMPAYEELDPP